MSRAILFFSERSSRGTLLSWFIPSACLAPILIVLVHDTTQFSLITPPLISSWINDIAPQVFVAASFLLFSSGLAFEVFSQTQSLLQQWKGSAFSVFAKSWGADPSWAISKVVRTLALTNAWDRLLPWVFGELVVLEIIFNSPGLALGAWSAATSRSPGEFFLYSSLFLALFCSFKWTTSRLRSKLSLRLTGYLR